MVPPVKHYLELSPPHPRSQEDYGSTSDIPSTEPATPEHVGHVLPFHMVVGQSESGEDREIKGHPVLKYRNGSMRCLTIVTASGKVSQCTRKSECPPVVGQRCGQTFRGQDELLRHVNTARWHRKVDEKPFECKVCRKQFSRRDALGRHRGSENHSTLFVLHRLVNRALTSPCAAREKGVQPQ